MSILVFDVNETLLDMRALDETFEELFGDASARHEWFNVLLQRAFTANLTGAYRDFATIGRSALKMVAAKRNRAVNDRQIENVQQRMQALPPHAEVPQALKSLRDAGFVLTALTQSPQSALDAQLSNSGLQTFFERAFSVDTVKRYKPSPEPYRMVAKEMQCVTEDLRLIAAHGWDVEGAMRAGCKAAFVARPGQVLDPDIPAPDIIGADLAEVAVELLGTAGALKA